MGLERKAEPAWPVWLGVSRNRKPPPSGSFCSFADPLSVHGVVFVVTWAAEMTAHSSIAATAFAELIFWTSGAQHACFSIIYQACFSGNPLLSTCRRAYTFYELVASSTSLLLDIGCDKNVERGKFDVFHKSHSNDSHHFGARVFRWLVRDRVVTRLGWRQHDFSLVIHTFC